MSEDRERQRRLDELARRATRRQFSRPIVLEAGAGTGKTAALVGRVLVWCLGPGWERNRAALAEELEPGAAPAAEAVAARVLERVTAITFTERAAAEMADRISAALAQVRRSEAPIGLGLDELGLGELEREVRASALLANLDRLLVGTIHGYCHRLLASFPLEAGLHPSFRVDADGRELRGAAQGLLAERMPALYGEPAEPDALALAARAAIGPAEVARALEVLAASRVRELGEDPFRPELVGRARERLGARLASLLELLRPALGRATSGRLKTAHASWLAFESLDRRLEAADTIESLGAAVGGVELEGALARLRQWARAQLTLSERAVLGSEEQRLAAASESLLRSLEHLRGLEPEILRAATRLLAPLLGELERRLRALGIESFEGLLDDARALLRDHPEVRRRVQRSTDQLLVDEFQDTDPVQCEIVRLLALEGEEPDRPGLFLVGDPKQSIYGWRSADLEAYDGFVEELCARGGERHTLCVNFRSSPPILDEVERVVAPIMLEQRGLQPPFQRLLPSGSPSPEGTASPLLSGGRAPVEHWIPRARGDQLRGHGPADRARRIEAAAVARDLVEQHRGGLPWSSFAVLLRSTSPLELYLQALRETGVPFVVERDRAYYRRREVIDATAVVRCVLDPSDQLALLSFLRASFVGVPDAALVPLWRQSLPELCARLGGPAPEALAEISRAIDAAVGSLPSGLPGLERLEGWPLSLTAALRSLAELRRSFQVDPADRFLERLRCLLLLEETEAARFLGSHRLANLDRFFRRLLGMLERPEGPQALLRELRSGVAGAREEEEGVLADESLEAVRVLTIHKAKGLTFDQVYLVGLHGRTQGNLAAATEAVRVGDGFELRLFGAASLGFDEIAERRARVEQAELVRTFYVAMTRPRHRLVLAGSWPDAGARRRPLERIRSHMDLLQHRQGDRPELDRDGLGASVDQGVRWVSFEERPESSLAARQEERGAAITLAEARRELGLLSEARGSAAALMARPSRGAASALGHGTPRESSAGEPDPPATLEPSGEGKPASPRAEIARIVGNAIHRLLERLDLRAPPARAIAAQQGFLEHELEALPAELRRPAAAELTAFCARLSGSRLLARLHALAEQVLARELPILLDPGTTSAGPTGVVVGSVDLLYRDPSSGGLVVADYKTDRVGDGRALEARARVHLEQGRVYLRAVQQALPSAPPARLELWFLAADRILVVE